MDTEMREAMFEDRTLSRVRKRVTSDTTRQYKRLKPLASAFGSYSRVSAVRPRMDSLPQYGSYEFIPYLSSPVSTNAPFSASTTPIPSADPPSDSQFPKLNNNSTWTYCGPLLAPNPTTLPSSLHTWTTTTMSSPAAFFSRLFPLLSFLRTFLPEAGVRNYWLTIRATKPTSEYDTPRWHVDDEFFSTDQARETAKREKRGKGKSGWKLCTTILGPPTLFLPSPTCLSTLRQTKKHQEEAASHMCTSIRCLGCADTGDAVRRDLAREFAAEHVTYPKRGEIAFFRLGDQEGAVHSEPKCNVDRIFINVVPGTEEDLRALMARWGMEFPRAWCYGIPVGFVMSDEFDDERRFEKGNNGLDSEVQGFVDQTVVDDEVVDEGLGIVNMGRRSTMSVSPKEEYSTWLESKGVRFARVFGQTREYQSLP